MRNIGTVNVKIPGLDGYIRYISDSSLRDYDIIIFDPTFPYLSRINFDGGGSCIDIDGTNGLRTAIAHWRSEIASALKSGKSIFVLLSSSSDDQGATGYSSPRKGHRSYTTSTINNYSAIPANIKLRNAKGRKIKVAQSEFSDCTTS